MDDPNPIKTGFSFERTEKSLLEKAFGQEKRDFYVQEDL